MLRTLDGDAGGNTKIYDLEISQEARFVGLRLTSGCLAILHLPEELSTQETERKKEEAIFTLHRDPSETQLSRTVSSFVRESGANRGAGENEILFPSVEEQQQLREGCARDLWNEVALFVPQNTVASHTSTSLSVQEGETVFSLLQGEMTHCGGGHSPHLCGALLAFLFFFLLPVRHPLHQNPIHAGAMICVSTLAETLLTAQCDWMKESGSQGNPSLMRYHFLYAPAPRKTVYESGGVQATHVAVYQPLSLIVRLLPLTKCQVVTGGSVEQSGEQAGGSAGTWRSFPMCC